MEPIKVCTDTLLDRTAQRLHRGMSAVSADEHRNFYEHNDRAVLRGYDVGEADGWPITIASVESDPHARVRYHIFCAGNVWMDRNYMRLASAYADAKTLLWACQQNNCTPLELPTDVFEAFRATLPKFFAEDLQVEPGFEPESHLVFTSVGEDQSPLISGKCWRYVAAELVPKATMAYYLRGKWLDVMATVASFDLPPSSRLVEKVWAEAGNTRPISDLLGEVKLGVPDDSEDE